MNDDLISRQSAIDALKNERSDWNCDYNVPIGHCIDAIYSVASAERKKGVWLEKHHAYADEEIIEEWQSCKCSICGRYDTRPYMYYFSLPNYCSYCGARMEGGNETD